MDTSSESIHKVRKVNKQEMERKRRARMNESLDKLRNIMYQQGFINETDCLKMEKAEILDNLVLFCENLCSSNMKQTDNISRSIPDQTNVTKSLIPATRIPLRLLGNNQINVDNNIKSEYRVLKPSFLADMKKFQSVNHQKENHQKIWKPYE